MQRIDEVDDAIEDMLREWRIVEEGGRSLKEACEQQLDERVCCMASFGDSLSSLKV